MWTRRRVPAGQSRMREEAMTRNATRIVSGESTDLIDVVQNLGQPRVLVLGDLMLEVDGKSIANIDEAKATFMTDRSAHLIHVLRGRAHFYVILRK